MKPKGDSKKEDIKAKDAKVNPKDVKKPLLDKKGKPIVEPEPEIILPPPEKESKFILKYNIKKTWRDLYM